jgi:acetamidase/formamidase
MAVREPSTTGQSLHDLPARPGNVHWGYFDASLAPALRVRSGDLIRAEAITHHAGDAPHLMMDADIRALYAAIPAHDRAPGVHIMTGPIDVADAMPGDMLEVRYLEMVPRLSYGSNLAAHWGYLYREMAERERVTIFHIDRATNQAAAVFAYDVEERYTVP